MKNTLIIVFIYFLFTAGSIAQEGQTGESDLLDMLDSISSPIIDYATSTFKTTRIVTGHSIESMKEGDLEFRISHRFGKVNGGFDQWWGLDQSSIFFSLEYGIMDWLEVGIGRAAYEKTFHGFTKLRLLKQSSGDVNMPVSISYFCSMGINSLDWENTERNNYFTSRLTFTHQLLIARKFNDDFSLQLTPTLVHRNLVQTALEDNDIYALGIGARYKISRRVSINAEYFYALRPTWNIETEYTNPISIGVDIETGGHVFQIMLSNSIGMIEKHYIAENTGTWGNGDIHLGFNISRVFTLY